MIIAAPIQMLHASLEEKEAQLIMQDEEINVKEAEISRLIKELKNCHSKLEELQVYSRVM